MEPKYTGWDHAGGQPVKQPVTLPGGDPATQIAQLEAQRRATVEALAAPQDSERLHRAQLAQVDQALADAKAEQARQALEAARQELARLYQANVAAIDAVTTALNAYVEALKNGGQISALFTAIPNRIDPSFAAFFTALHEALAAQDRYLSAVHLGSGDTPAGRGAFLQAMIEARNQVLSGPIALPSTLALQRWIVGAPAGSPDRTLRAALAFAVSGNPSVINTSDQTNWPMMARSHVDACLQAGRPIK